MYIAAIRALLKLTDRGTLKDKRRVVKGFLAEMEREYHLSAAETGRQDSTAFFEAGLCRATSDHGVAQRTIDHVSRRIYEDPRFCYVELETEIIPMG
jgi:uncharacterized protein YlxP (DUF503 family)